MRVFMYVYIYVYIYYMHVYICPSICRFIYTYMYVCVCMYIHTHISHMQAASARGAEEGEIDARKELIALEAETLHLCTVSPLIYLR